MCQFLAYTFPCIPDMTSRHQQNHASNDSTYDVWSPQYLVHFLKSIGYHGIEASAIDGLYYYVISMLANLSNRLHQWSQFGGRNSPHALDIYTLFKMHSLQPSDLLLFLSKQKSIYRHYIQHTKVESEKKLTESVIESKTLPKPIQSSIESIFGEGIPSLPPVHTFKRTVLPVQRNFQASKIVLQTAIERRRLEQNLKNLLKFSQTGPKTVSYDRTMLMTIKNL